MGDRTQRFRERYEANNHGDLTAKAQRANSLIRKGRLEEGLAILKDIYPHFSDDAQIISTLAYYSDYSFIDEYRQRDKFTALYLLDKITEEFGPLQKIEVEDQFGEPFDKQSYFLAIPEDKITLYQKLEDLSESDKILKDRLWQIGGAFNERIFLPSQVQELAQTEADIYNVNSFTGLDWFRVENYNLGFPHSSIGIYVDSNERVFQERKIVKPIGFNDCKHFIQLRRKVGRIMNKIEDQENLEWVKNASDIISAYKL